jgi:hypothetical protein
MPDAVHSGAEEEFSRSDRLDNWLKQEGSERSHAPALAPSSRCFSGFVAFFPCKGRHSFLERTVSSYRKPVLGGEEGGLLAHDQPERALV